jgi:hypothetical protein
LPNQAQNGYAFEYAIIESIPIAIDDWISRNQRGSCNVALVKDRAYLNIQEKFLATTSDLQSKMRSAARAGLRKILDMEPRMVFTSEDDPLIISSNPASNGIAGDVRDIVMIRQLSQPRRRLSQNANSEFHPWEIGISAKWNNDVIKNSRLAAHLDFCNSWFGFPCSEEYWREIETPMNYIQSRLGSNWNSLPQKKQLVYLPIANAFINEVERQSRSHPNLSELLVNYLIGKFDFYKMIAKRDQRITDIQVFNLRGNLNQPNTSQTPLIRINSQANQRPTRIVNIGHYHEREAWVEIILDNGWQFTLRLHNAETRIIPSLKFDIRFSGSPVNTWSENW